MANKLLHKCDVCNSWFWCGMPCGRLVDNAIIVAVDEVLKGEPIALGEAQQAEASALPSYKYRDPEKRRAYMKEYMRKRRAKE